MKTQLFQIAKESGQEILKFYGDKCFESKEDNSPITKADRASHDYLTKVLPQVKDLPVLSEENPVDYAIRENWKEFWIVDPLDGTKEFVNNCDDFCINIALIKNNKPVLGVIYAPVLDELYWAEKGKGFECNLQEKMRCNDDIVVAKSRFHHSKKTQEFMNINNLQKTYVVGAAIKFGRMAMGHIDLYPRFEGSKEWDTAAGQILLQESGSNIIDLATGCELEYNKSQLKNNFFIAFREGVDLENLKFPSYERYK